jgi:hypothetical protein
MNIESIIEIARRDEHPPFEQPLLPGVLDRIECLPSPELRVLAAACLISGGTAAILTAVALFADRPTGPAVADPFDALLVSAEARIP